MDRIQTSDIFRAAYHITREDRLFAVSITNEDEKEFIIKGENLYSEDWKYRAGQAIINPLVFEKSIRLLEEMNKKNLSPFQTFGFLRCYRNHECETDGDS